MQKLGQHLQERMQTPNEDFVRTSAEDVKARARQALNNADTPPQSEEEQK